MVEVVDGSALTWKMTQAMEDWKPTSFGFGLLDRDHRTVMKFFHRNWPHDGEHFAISNYCWGQLLHGLKLYVERGQVIPFDRRMRDEVWFNERLRIDRKLAATPITNEPFSFAIRSRCRQRRQCKWPRGRIAQSAPKSPTEKRDWCWS